MSFIHFGCWGNLNDKVKFKNENTETIDRGSKPLEKYPIHHVVEAIQKDIDRRKINFVSVAGDNYYPTKVMKDEEKIKQVNVTKVNTLMDQLEKLYKNLYKTIYLLYGNHEMSDKAIYIDEDLSTPQRPCVALSKQLERLRKIHETNPKMNVQAFMDTMHVGLNSHTIVIMLDTTIYDDVKVKKKDKKDKGDNTKDKETKDKPKEKDNIHCYKDFEILYKTYMENEFNGEVTNKHLRLIQLMQVVGILNANPNKKNIVFVGHHPIISFKQKKKEDKETGEKKMVVDPANNKNLQLFFRRLNIILNQRLASDSTRLHYLCADTHLYEKSLITLHPRKELNDAPRKRIKIHQYIIGTGGTELDIQSSIEDIKKYISKKSDDFENIDYTINAKERFDNCYGYLKIKHETYNKSKLKFQFIKVVSKTGEILWKSKSSLWSRSRSRSRSKNTTRTRTKSRTKITDPQTRRTRRKSRIYVK